MKPFLKHTTEMLMDKYGSDLSKCCIVFPNRRSGLFFRKYLSEITEKPFWSPEITTINDLMKDLSGLQLADNLTLVFELYNIYKKHKENVESFDDFYFWGEMLLNDFDDLDKYLVDTKDIFQNLSSLKEIKGQFNYLSKEQLEAIQTFWQSFNPEKFSKHQTDFVQIWNILYNIYYDFNKFLSENKIAYEGKIYREVAEKINKKEHAIFSSSHYIFIGFNALTPCEEKLFDRLVNLKQAEFYWDYANYYVEDKFHEAGLFLRKNIKRYPSKEHTFSINDFEKDKNHIEFIACPSDISQTKIAGEILSNFSEAENTDANRTAVVLADEHLLIPVLYSIPENIAEINVTMGYPIRNTPIFSLLEQLIELQKKARIQKNGKVTYYYKNVLAVLQHQYVQRNLLARSNLIDNIIKNNKIYIDQEELHTNDLLKLLFEKVGDISQISDYLLNILHTIAGLLNQQNETGRYQNMLNKEYVYHAITEVKRLKDVIENRGINLSVEVYWRLVRKRIQSIRIPFSGEPLTGLQVMGLLETRVLDFENVIIISMNEGVFPRTDLASSFIPYNLRKGFGLPTIEHQDAIYSYYFYRLLQRAKNVFLLYNDNAEGLQTGERSRYLHQLIYESNFSITEKSVAYDVNIQQPKKIEIKKTASILSKLDNYLLSGKEEKYLSPSALNTYLTCSLRFYFKYIASLAEPDVIDEEVDAALFGSLLHYSMDRIYLPFKDKIVQLSDLEKLFIDDEYVEQIIREAFQKVYFKFSAKKIELTGRNIIIEEVLKKYIKQIIKIDKEYAPFSILGLEDFFTTTISIEVAGKKKNIRLGGKIDRIDKVGETIRIIDYKTGTVKFTFDDILSLFHTDQKKRNESAFQTLLYALLYAENNSNDCVLPSLYSTKELFSNQFEYVLKHNKNVPLSDFKEVASEFTEHLTLLLQNIFNPNIDFTQVEDTEVCKNCPYIGICHRGN